MVLNGEILQADVWVMNPDNYPLYSLFIEGIMFSVFYAATRHNDPIDINAQADVEQLCYLFWSDVVVSNDEAFFKTAFDELWKPRGKRLMNCEEFVVFLSNVSGLR